MEDKKDRGGGWAWAFEINDSNFFSPIGNCKAILRSRAFLRALPGAIVGGLQGWLRPESGHQRRLDYDLWINRSQVEGSSGSLVGVVQIRASQFGAKFNSASTQSLLTPSIHTDTPRKWQSQMVQTRFNNRSLKEFKVTLQVLAKHDIPRVMNTKLGFLYIFGYFVLSMQFGIENHSHSSKHYCCWNKTSP